MKKLILVCMVSIFLTGFNVAQASLLLNEIMYDLPDSDEGKEWIEVYNSGPESVDLSEYKFFEADTNHKLLLVQGVSEVPAGRYAVIADKPEKFKSGFPSFSGTLFDSAFILSNTGEALALKDADLNITDSYFYSSALGGAGDGKSLQKIDGMWRASKPTPGAENIFVVPSVPKPDSQPPPKKVPTPNGVEIIPTENVGKKEPEPLQNNTITASVVNTPDLPIPEEKNSAIYLITLFILIVLGGTAVYFIRSRKLHTDRRRF